MLAQTIDKTQANLCDIIDDNCKALVWLYAAEIAKNTQLTILCVDGLFDENTEITVRGVEFNSKSELRGVLRDIYQTQHAAEYWVNKIYYADNIALIVLMSAEDYRLDRLAMLDDSGSFIKFIT